MCQEFLILIKYKLFCCITKHLWMFLNLSWSKQTRLTFTLVCSTWVLMKWFRMLKLTNDISRNNPDNWCTSRKCWRSKDVIVWWHPSVALNYWMLEHIKAEVAFCMHQSDPYIGWISHCLWSINDIWYLMNVVLVK